MKKKPNIITSPNKGGNKNQKWVNKEEKTGQVLTEHKTKKNAEKAGRKIAKENKSEHTIQKLNGQIGEKNSYGNDPLPPKDKD